MSTPQFPAEVLEQIVPHLADDPISLSICCLSSRVFVPACRVARFQSITLEEQEDSTKFHALLESSPTSAVTRQVKSLTIIDPQLFNYKKYRDAVTGIFDHLRTVIVHLQIFNKMENYRIHWPHLVWLQDGISELSLQSFGTEDWNFAPKPITPWPCSGDDAALGLFDLPSHVNTRSVVERLRLSAFRLSHIRGRPVQKYLDSGLLKWLDFSRLRALAFCTRINDTPDSTGTYLSALIQPCSASLEYLVFEPKNPANDLELPLGGCPRLKRAHHNRYI
ncbi:hypothetical protein DL96DRAFT_1765468 [Flagelloscypha sp. PMI_526]|nr:hypothetical protein DL96DRAFT_1765468 [Flagelloscypha sp. PMI_526]